MGQIIDYFRYEYPRLFNFGVALCVIAAFLLLFMLLPPTPVFRAMGVTGLQTRLGALYFATFWRTRAVTSRTAQAVRLDVKFGTMAGLDQTGRVIVSVPAGKKFELRGYHIADVKIIDPYSVASLIGQLRTEDARLDIYPDDQVVIWIRGVPFNVKLIESGYAVPDPNPPTNIVDEAFSTYYWRIFCGD